MVVMMMMMMVAMMTVKTDLPCSLLSKSPSGRRLSALLTTFSHMVVIVIIVIIVIIGIIIIIIVFIIIIFDICDKHHRKCPCKIINTQTKFNFVNVFLEQFMYVCM